MPSAPSSPTSSPASNPSPLTEDQAFLNGASAAVKWTGHAVAPSGKEVTFEGFDVIDTNPEGQITHVRAFWDPTPVFAALTP
jgi:steroid delta-isomerase